MNETLKNIIIADLQKLIDESRLDGCGCTSGDYQNPPEQCDACWSKIELKQISDWYLSASHDLDACDLDACMAVVESHFVIKWYREHAAYMIEHDLDETQRTVLFCYDILPILSEELK